MRSRSLTALSAVGLSCASAGSPTSGGAPLPGGQDRPAPLLVGESSLGSLRARKWRLSNGLEVILVPDPTATSVAYMTWLRVGSRHEDADNGQTGLAHLFEHLMFTQSGDQPGPGEFDRRMEEAGAATNAMTAHDFTAYIDQVPASALPLAIRLEADRLVNLQLGEEQVRTERDVVVEERLGSVDDSVDGTLEEMLYSRAFERHPYRFPVIGRMEDIRGVSTDTARAFYRTHYAPNNAVLVVAGRFDADALLAAVDAGYGRLHPSTALARHEIAPESPLARPVRVAIERPVPADRLLLGFPAPALGATDRAAFEVLDEILTGGPSARLHRRLVIESAMASSVDGGPSASKDPGLYSLWVQMRRGHLAAEAESAVSSEIEALLLRGLAEGELDKAKNRLETAFWRALASSEGKATQLGEFEVVTGSFENLMARATQIAAVTGEDVRAAVSAYLATPRRAVLVAHPAEKAPARPSPASPVVPSP